MSSPPADPSARVLWWLMGANLLVFVAWHQVDPRLVGPHFLVSADAVAAGRVYTLITSTFSHYDANHLLFNMLALYVFGRGILDVVGTRGLVHLYLAGGIAASLGHVAYGLISGEANPALGASGSVMAIAVVFAALRPRARLLINFIVPLPAIIAVALYVLADISGVLGGPAASNVAHAAHLGGAAYGLGYWFVVLRGRAIRPKAGSERVPR